MDKAGAMETEWLDDHSPDKPKKCPPANPIRAPGPFKCLDLHTGAIP